MAYFVENKGREIVTTDYWRTPQAATRTAYTINAGALRVLVAASLAAEAAREAPSGKIAVLSIGPDKRHDNRVRACLMLDDGSDSPYCLESDLEAFDGTLPDRAADSRRDLECIIYGPGLAVLARMPLRIRHTHCPDYSPAR